MRKDCSQELRCPCDAPAERLARLVRLAGVNGYVAVRDGSFIEVDSRLVWSCPNSLRTHARDEGNCVSDVVINTKAA